MEKVLAIGFSWQQILIILVIALLLFGGGGKITQLMGDFAKGIKAFRKGLQEDDKLARPDTAKDVTPKEPDAKNAAKPE